MTWTLLNPILASRWEVSYASPDQILSMGMRCGAYHPPAATVAVQVEITIHATSNISSMYLLQ
jgi:hypothetical protein